MPINKSLCELERQGFVVTNFKDYRKLVRHGEFLCQDCGRVARKKRNLCNPKRLYPQEKSAK